MTLPFLICGCLNVKRSVKSVTVAQSPAIDALTRKNVVIVIPSVLVAVLTHMLFGTRSKSETGYCLNISVSDG